MPKPPFKAKHRGTISRIVSQAEQVAVIAAEQVAVLAAEWVEEDHPRREDGKWGSGGPGAKSETKSQSPEEKAEKKAEKAEQVWKEKYADKWEPIMDDDVKVEAALKEMPRPSRAERYLMPGAASRKDWVEEHLDEINEIMGTDFTMDDFAADKQPTAEEAVKFADWANELDSEMEYKPEDFETIEGIERHAPDLAAMEGEHAMRFGHLLPKYRGGHNKIAERFEKEVHEDVTKFREVFADEPEFIAAIDFQEELDAVRARRYAQGKSLYRGTGVEELENLSDGGYIGAGADHGIISTSISKNIGKQFSHSLYGDKGGIMLEFSKDEIGEGAQDVRYSGLAGEEYTENGHLAGFSYEEEYAIQRDSKIKPKSLKIHVTRPPREMNFEKRFGHLGEIIYDY